MSKSKQRKVNKKTNPNAMEWKQKVDKEIENIKSIMQSLIVFADTVQQWKSVDLRHFIQKQPQGSTHEETNTSSKAENVSKEKGESNVNKKERSKTEKIKSAV